MNNKIVLLAVDDEQIIIDSINKILRKEDNYELHFALSVNEALKIIESKDVDIILTDLMMPEKDGLEFLKILRDMNYPAYVIMLTGYATINSALQAMEIGAFDYLAKPFTREEITRVINRASDLVHLKRSQTAIEHPIQLNKKYQNAITTTGKNTWFMTLQDDLLLIGVERPILIEIGSIVSVYLPEVGDEIRQGSVFLEIVSSDLRTHSATAPFSGTVVEVNKYVIENPDKLIEDPYDKGWLIKIKPVQFEEELSVLSLKY